MNAADLWIDWPRDLRRTPPEQKQAAREGDGRELFEASVRLGVAIGLLRPDEDSVLVRIDCLHSKGVVVAFRRQNIPYRVACDTFDAVLANLEATRELLDGW